MFEEIKELLTEISDFPNLYVSQNTEYVLEPIPNTEVKDYYKYLKFSIVRRGSIYSDSVVYQASCKENNPKAYLEVIIKDLKTLKNKYLLSGGHV